MDLTDMHDHRSGLRPIRTMLLTATVMLAGCASSGDVEQVRQEREQAKAKMSAELQQERKLAQSMEQESEARKAEADKLAKALGGGAAAKALAPRQAAGMTLTAALQNNNCLDQIAARSPNPLVPQALFIGGTLPTKGGNSACTSVTVSTTDATFTASAPLIPVVVGSGGTLTVQDPGAGNQMTLYASSFLIQSAGTMSAGSVSTPVAGQITIVMAGNASAALAPRAMGAAPPAPIVTTSNNAPNARDITVMDGGTLALYGGKGLSAPPDGTHNKPVRGGEFINTVYGTKSWTYLAAPAGPAKYNDAENVSAPVPATNPDTTLTLARQVDWQVNDWISIATTSFSSHQTEIVQICAITSVSNPDTTLVVPPPLVLPSQVSQITLCNKLKHYHYGGLAPTPGFFPAKTKQVVVSGGNAIDVSFQAKSFYDDHRRNYGIDERAEVSLLSRNIKLTSVAGQSTDANNFVGGHLVAMVSGTTSPTLTLVGVEIEKFGQGLVGRYPVHLHRLPSGNNVLAQDVSVHHSYNKCYVVHGTDNANFYNNVCVRTVGQGVYLEDGNNITANQFMRNHIAGTMAANSTYSYPRQNGSTYWDGDNLQSSNTSANWYNINSIPDTSRSGLNTAAIDSSFPGGFWITNLGNTFVNNSVAGCQAQGRGYWLLSQAKSTDPNVRSGYPEFTGNRVHACYNGIDSDDVTGNGNDPTPLLPTPSYQITKVSPSSIVITSPTPFPNPQYVPTVMIAGTNIQSGTWPVTNVQNTRSPYTFSVKNATISGTYSGSGGTWQLGPLPLQQATKASGQNVVIAVPPPFSSALPANGSQVTVTGTGTGLDGNQYVVMQSTPGSSPTFMLSNSQSVTGTFPASSGNWQAQANPITAVTSSPIVITSSTVPANNAQVTIAGVGGTTAANGIWTVTVPAPGQGAGTFALNGSAGTSSYTSGGTWQLTQQAPVLVLNDNTVTRSRQRGLWMRSIYTALHNNRFATNPYGFTLLGGGGPEGNYPGYWGMAHENVIAGMTRNNVERYPACSNPPANAMQECTDVSGPTWGNFPDPTNGMNVQGYSYYDGPARIEHNRFVNFRFDPTGLHPTDQAARLLTKTDIATLAAQATKGQLSNPLLSKTAQSAGSKQYSGYAGDPATGWQQSNAQTVPPTQYIQDSLWDNVDFKHQVYTEAVNMGAFNDGDKTTVILDKDGQLSGLRVVNAAGQSDPDMIPVSLNSVDFYATDYTVDEPHSRGPNDFRSTSLMSPHRYATLHIESVDDPPGAPAGSMGPESPANIPTYFHVQVMRDMPAYGDTVYPYLFLNGRGQNPIYEPFVMDRMGYSVYGLQGTEHYPANQSAMAFKNRLLFSYTDHPVKKVGDYFVSRIAVSQPVSTPGNIKVYRIRRQWGQAYPGSTWPPRFAAPVVTPSCDAAFYSMNQSNTQETGWSDCMNRANNVAPYTGGMTIPAATGATAAEQWTNFEQPFKTLVAKGSPTAQDIATFINGQTYFYDTTNKLLYFYMIEEKPILHQYSPFGTCDAANYATGLNYLAQIQQIKAFSNESSVQRALDAACLVSGGTWQWGSSTPYPITNVANATVSGIGAVVVTSLSSPPTGTQVTIAGVQGIAGINTTWTVTNIDASHFSLNNSSSITSGTYTGAVPQSTDLFACHGTGCVAYLVDLTSAGASGPGSLPPSSPAHPIARTAYQSWNQYQFVYDTPTQQPNGVPVAANAAIGNTVPPQDGAALTGMATPTDGTPPPSGDQVTYSFTTLILNTPSGQRPPAEVSVTENFHYRCMTNPPWAPVNARGAYPPTGGFTYPLAPSVCAP